MIPLGCASIQTPRVSIPSYLQAQCLRMRPGHPIASHYSRGGWTRDAQHKLQCWGESMNRTRTKKPSRFTVPTELAPSALTDYLGSFLRLTIPSSKDSTPETRAFCECSREIVNS